MRIHSLRHGSGRLWKRASRRRLLACELLEDRWLLSTIELTLQGFDATFGSAPYADIDGDGILETTSEAAQNVVRAAARHWQEIIGDFNYSDGANEYELEVFMAPGGTGFGAVTSADVFGFDAITNSPTGATVTLNRGGDTGSDGNGDGWGYFLDPTPDDWSEFPTIVNAFAGDADLTHPAYANVDLNNDLIPDFRQDPDGNGINGMFDFYSVVAHEIGHAMGFSAHQLVAFPNALAEDTQVLDNDALRNGLGPGTLWTWRSPRAPRTLLTDSNGSSQADKPVHVANTPALLTSQGDQFFGVVDLMNPIYPENQRHLVSDLDVAVLTDSYEYTAVRTPDRWGTLYSYLDQSGGPDHGLLTVRGPDGSSDDLFEIGITDDQVVVSVNIGNDVPGTLAWQKSNRDAWLSTFPTDNVDRIVVETNDGTDFVKIRDITDRSIPVTVEGGADQDTLQLDKGTSNADVTFFGQEGRDLMRVEGAGPNAIIRFLGHAGDDQLIIGNTERTKESFPLADVRGHIIFTGGFDHNTVRVVHAEDIDVYANRLGHPGGARMAYSDVDTVQVTTRWGDQEVRVHSLSDDVALTINEFENVNPGFPPNTGSLAVIFSPVTMDMSAIQGDVSVITLGADDAVTFNDSRSISNRTYRMGQERGSTGGSEIRDLTTFETQNASGPLGSYRFLSNKTFTLNSTAAEATVIFESQLGTDWTINTGDQDDELRLTPVELVFEETPFGGRLVPVGGMLGSLGYTGSIHFNANGGQDRLRLDDSRSDTSNAFHVGSSAVAFGYAEPVEFTGVEEVAVHASDFDDRFFVPQLLEPIDVTLLGNDGDDRYELGFSSTNPSIQRNLIANLKGRLDVDGGSGNNTLVIVDRDGRSGAYTVDTNRFTREGGLLTPDVEISHNDIDVLRLSTSQTHANNVRVSGFDGNIELQVLNADDVELGFGTTLGTSNRLNRIHGQITINGPIGMGASLTILDQNSREDDAYELQRNQFTAFQASGDLAVNYSEFVVGTLELNAGGGNNRIDIQSNLFVNSTVHAGSGNDLIRVAPRSGDPSALLKPVVIHGDTGTDMLEIFDTGDNSNVDYRIDGRNVHAVDEWSVDVSDVDIVALFGSDGSNTFDIESTDAGIEYRLSGKGGNDTFNVGLGNYDLGIRGNVSIFGGDDENQVIVDDRNDPLKGFLDSYIFTSAGFTKQSEVTVGLLAIDEVDTFTLRGNHQGTLFDVDATAEGTEYKLFGNGGDDVFDIDVAGLRSNVIAHGGPHVTEGDSLIVRNGVETGTVYEPDALSADSGEIRNIVNYYGSSTITFTGLEPVQFRNFEEVSLVTPRSQDILNIDPAPDAGIRISGVSIHGSAVPIPGFPPPPALPVGFELLEAWNVDRIVVDTGTNNFRVIANPPYAYPPPNGTFDQVTINPGALQARGLEELRIETGPNPSVVRDRTLEGQTSTLEGPIPTARLTVQGVPGWTTVIVPGNAPQAEMVQASEQVTRLVARDATGELIHEISLEKVELLVMPDPWQHVRAIGEDLTRVFSVFDTESQSIAGPGLTTVRILPTIDDGVLDIVALGESRVELGGVAFARPSISGVRDAGPQPEPPASPDSIIIAPVFAGPQPEPPSPPIEIRDFGPEDHLVFESPVVDGVPQPADYFTAFGETLTTVGVPVTTTQQLTYTLEMPVGKGHSPVVVLAGHEGLTNSGRISTPAVADLPRATTNWYVETRHLTRIDVAGGSLDDMFTLTPQSDGGLVGAIMPIETNAPFEVFLRTDRATRFLDYSGGEGADEFAITYPEPGFRELTVDLHELETASLAPDPAAILIGLLQPVRQRLTPTTGAFSTGNLLVTHDQAVTVSRIEATSVELLVTPDITSDTFRRNLSLGFKYLGSEGQFVLEDVHFADDFELTVEHKDGTTNRSVVQARDVDFEQSSTIRIVGANEGQDHVLVSATGKSTNGSLLDLDLQGGDDLVVVTESNNGQSSGTLDKVLVQGDGTATPGSDTKTILYHKEKAVAPQKQLADLIMKRPVEAPLIEDLAQFADQKLLAEQGAPQLAQGTKQLAYEGQETDVDIYVFNGDPEAINLETTNSNGTTTQTTDGNVQLNYPVLIGTGIMPTGAFRVVTVTNALNSGPGSLRWAIETANALGGSDLAVIAFAIPATDPGFQDIDASLGGDQGPDVFVLVPSGSLPALSRDNIVINGQSQHILTGDTNPFGPEIVLDGSTITDIANGLQLDSDGNRVHGLTIHSFGGSGILITAERNTVTESYIGTDPTGTIDLGNGNIGVFIIDAAVNTIEGNVISGNDGSGVVLSGILATDNVVRGNRIGTNADGTGRLGNQMHGILVHQFASQTDISDNVISGNEQDGVHITGGRQIESLVHSWKGEGDAADAAGDAPGTLYGGAGFLQGRAADTLAFRFDGLDDYVRMDSSETMEPNSLTVSLWMNSTDEAGPNDYLLNKGGDNQQRSSYALARHGDQVTFSIFDGVSMVHSPGIHADRIYDSYWHHLAGSFDGETVRLYVDGEEVGDGTPTSGPIAYGLTLSNDLYLGSYIEAAGDQFHFGGRIDEVTIFQQALAPAQMRTLQRYGIPEVGGNRVAGNHIGTTADGFSALGNTSGVRIEDSTQNVIGGATEFNDHNTISGNGTGVHLGGYGSSDNVVFGNYIGTDVSGTARLANVDGVWLVWGSNNLVGGSAEHERNVISGNTRFGIGISNTEGNFVQGNYIGLDKTGDGAISNKSAGIGWVSDMGTVIGGTQPGEGNTISGNGNGIWIYGGNPGKEGRIEGNRIGTTADGLGRLGNADGILIIGGGGNKVFDLTIGGTEPGAGNLLSGNSWNGIHVTGENSLGIQIQGNRIGTDIDGTESVPNGRNGVLIENAGGILLGGTEPGAGNIISGNTGDGVQISGSAPETKTNTYYSSLAWQAGWTGYGNTSNRNSFTGSWYIPGLSDDSFVAGGTFARASTALGETVNPPSFYADPRLGGILTLDDPIHAEGDLIIANMQDWNNNVLIGHFDRTAAEANLSSDLLGLAILEPSPQQGANGIRAAAWIRVANGNELLGSWVNGSSGLDLNTNYSWRYDYAPDAGANGAGELTVEVFADGTSLGTSRLELTADQREIGASLDAFGFYNNPLAARSNNPNTVRLYVDNVSYTRVVGNTIQGNYIGTTADGMAALGNGGAGVLIQNSADNLIGGVNLETPSVTSQILWPTFAGGAAQIVGAPDGDFATLANGASTTVESFSQASDVNTDALAAALGLTASELADVDFVAFEQNGLPDFGFESSDWVFDDTTNVVSVSHAQGGGPNGPIVKNGSMSAATFNGIFGSGAGGDGVSVGYLLFSFSDPALDLTRLKVTITGGTGSTVYHAPDLLGVAVLNVSSSQPTRAGNVISGNTTGISIVGAEATGNHIAGNYIGLGSDGATDLGNFDGIIVSGGASRNVIGGTTVGERNVISGSSRYGVYGSGANATVIQGNYLGTDATGTAAVANFSAGIALFSDTNTVIGGTTPGAGNVISGNSTGINAASGGTGVRGTRILGNLIGTTAAGDQVLAQGTGILVSGSGHHVAADVVIGGAQEGAGNVISGNTEGIHVRGENATGIRIVGNYIGTDITGRIAFSNSIGVSIQDAGGNTVDGNIISGNTQRGVYVSGPTGVGNRFVNNSIGVGVDGRTAVPNGVGVYIAGSTNNMIGTPDEGNVIAYNGAGVVVTGATAVGNRIRGNSIHSNSGLGIDLGGDGVTLNDPGDGDAGANALQNFPTIESARRRDGELRIRGRLDSTPSTSFIIDLYASTQADPSGFGEAQRWLTAIEVTTKGNGVAQFEVVVDASLATVGEWITATATELVLGNTSEISAAENIRGEGVPIGGLVINEIMANPEAVPDAAGEWFELFNPTDQAVQLQGLIIEGAGGTRHVITDRVSVPAGGYRVLGNNGQRTANGDVRVDYVYQDITLSNSGGSLRIVDPSGIEVDRVSWLATTAGVALALRDPSLDNGLRDNWCLSGTAYGDGDLGTPRAANICVPELPELVITEIMQNPDAVPDASGEWFEVYNPMSVAADLNGLSIQSNGGSHVIDGDDGTLLLRSGQYLVLGINREMASNGGVPVDYQYTGIALGNSSDSLSLLDRSGSQIIDSVSWDDGLTFPDPTGASMALVDPALGNDLGSNWCASRTPFGDGDLGTPGAENDCLVEVPQLVINEVMANPAAVSDSVGEWFELFNPTDQRIQLRGLLIEAGGVQHTITDRVGVPAGGYRILGSAADRSLNGNVRVDYEYDGISLLNDEGVLRILDPRGIEIDRAVWNGTVDGVALALADPTLDNANAENWSLAGTPYGDGDLGSPRKANVVQPAAGALPGIDDPIRGPSFDILVGLVEGASPEENPNDRYFDDLDEELGDQVRADIFANELSDLLF